MERLLIKRDGKRTTFKVTGPCHISDASTHINRALSKKACKRHLQHLKFGRIKPKIGANHQTGRRRPHTQNKTIKNIPLKWGETVIAQLIRSGALLKNITGDDLSPLIKEEPSEKSDGHEKVKWQDKLRELLKTNEIDTDKLIDQITKEKIELGFQSTSIEDLIHIMRCQKFFSTLGFGFGFWGDCKDALFWCFLLFLGWEWFLDRFAFFLKIFLVVFYIFLIAFRPPAKP